MKYHGIGRRKSAVAQVYIKSQGVTVTSLQINKKKVFDYFQNDQNSIQKIQQIFKTLPLAIIVKVKGGGLTGQQEAICLALSKALYSSGLCPLLKKQITQDARVKERKKYGLKKARKAPQYSKR